MRNLLLKEGLWRSQDVQTRTVAQLLLQLLIIKGTNQYNYLNVL